MINTTLCYIEKNDSYLMLHRIKKQKDLNKDKWIGIGGKFEENESPQDCILRETFEETGLTINSLEYRGIVTFISEENGQTYYELMHIFWTDDFSGIPFASDDCSEGDLQWIPKSKMNDLPHWKGDEIFLDLLDKKVPFFSLKLIYKNGQLISHTLY